jgi:hypothetical protein
MTIKNLYPIERPSLSFNFQNSRQLDPKLAFARASIGTFVGSNGLIQTAAANVPRFQYHSATGESLGLLVEESRTNLLRQSDSFTTSWSWPSGVTVSPLGQVNPPGLNVTRFTYSASPSGPGPYQTVSVVSGTVYTASFWIRGVSSFPSALNVVFNDGPTTVPVTSSWQRVSVQITASSTGTTGFRFDRSPTANAVYDIAGMQLEAGSFPTSYIPTTTAAVTRAADQVSIATGIPTTGSLFIDARAIGISAGGTLLTAANSSNNKLLLQIQQPSNLYGSTGLVYSVNGTFKPTLPFPVPTTNRERNLITWGANNYHYCADQSRSTASNAVNVPAGMNRLEIGYDSTDPTKGFNGYINSIYMWNSELQPAVAAGVVQGTITLKDADAEGSGIPSNAFAMVFNTQGVGSTGDKNVVLPLRGSTNNISVDWGDNTISTLIGSAASANVTKAYQSAGVYRVQITSADDGTNRDLKQLQFSGSATPADLYRIQQWGGVFKPTTMNAAFSGCTKLDLETAARTNLPDTSAVTDWAQAFYNCSSISGTFPTFNTTAATTFNGTWFGCSSLTSFPLITSNSVTNFTDAWRGCSSLTSFPLINTAAGTNFGQAWRNCSSLTSFPLLNTAAGTNFSSAWDSCAGLTSFPLINTGVGTNFTNAWYNCSSLTSFPSINTAAGTNFANAWIGCSNLTSFPELVFNAATGLASDVSTSSTGFRSAWQNCTNLATFPDGRFNSTTCTRYLDAFTACALTAASIGNIIVSINAAGTSNGNLSLQGGTNAGASTWTTAAVTAYNALVARGWTITRNA